MSTFAPVLSSASALYWGVGVVAESQIQQHDVGVREAADALRGGFHVTEVGDVGFVRKDLLQAERGHAVILESSNIDSRIFMLILFDWR